MGKHDPIYGVDVMFYNASDADFEGWILRVNGYYTLNAQCDELKMKKDDLIHLLEDFNGIHSHSDDQCYFQLEEYAKNAAESLEGYMVLMVPMEA